MEKPCTTVIIPAYNAGSTITETLASLLEQSRKDFEVIVIDDGSTDNTLQLVRECQGAFTRCTILAQKNKGQAAARNYGLQYAQGKYIALLDADDCWMPSYLEVMTRQLEASSADLIYPNAIFMGDLHPGDKGRTYMEVYPSRSPVTLEDVLSRRTAIFISALFKRSAIEACGGFNEAYRGIEDLELWITMLMKGCSFTFTTEPLVKYRRTPGSASSKESVQLMQLITLYRYLATQQLRYGELMAITEQTRVYEGRLMFVQGVELAQKGEYRTARDLFVQAHRRLGGKKCLAFRLVAALHPAGLRYLV